MDWIEVHPLPEACLDCKEEDCYNCDTAGQRWVLSAESELLLKRTAVRNSIDRLSRELAEIEQALEKITKPAPKTQT